MFAGVDADAFDFIALFLSGVFGILMADIFFVRSIVLLSEDSQDACLPPRAPKAHWNSIGPAQVAKVVL